MVEAIVELDYTGSEPDELNLKKGDIVKDITQKPGGRWEGTVNNKKGHFPEECVKLMDKSGVVLRNKQDLTRVRQCRATYSYQPDHEDELALKTGDVITIIGEEEEGWWRGLLRGKIGVFPSNFVEEIAPIVKPKHPVEEPPKSKPTAIDDSVKLRHHHTPDLLPKLGKQKCKARFSYKAENTDELSLTEGDIITILSKDGLDQGWWKGELNGKVGVFPDNFVIPVLGADEKKPTTKLSKSPSDVSPSKPTLLSSHRKSLDAKTPPVKPSDQKAQPPLPGKKPTVVVKKSPSGMAIFTKLKDKLHDVVDGSSGSKAKVDLTKDPIENGNNYENATITTSSFDDVERNPILADPRAGRVRAPGRRLPKGGNKTDDDEPSNLLNGSVHSNKLEHSTKSEDSFKSEGNSSSENLDFSSDMETSETKPKLREWEKHKAPWLAEMKLSQAKRTSVSPSPESKPRLPPIDPPKLELAEMTKSIHTSPIEKDHHAAVDMSKSMTEMKISPLMEEKPIPRPAHKTPPSELEKITVPPVIKSKPVVPSVNRHSIGAIPRDFNIKPSAPQPQKVQPKPIVKPPSELFDISVPAQKHSASSVTTSISQSTHISASSSTHSSEKIDHSTTIIDQAKFNEVIERLAKLEAKCDKQEQLIDDLRNRLQVETEMRMILQEKIVQGNVHV